MTTSHTQYVFCRRPDKVAQPCVLILVSRPDVTRTGDFDRGARRMAVAQAHAEPEAAGGGRVCAFAQSEAIKVVWSVVE